MYTKHVDSQNFIAFGGGVSTIKPQIAFLFSFILFRGISSSKDIGYSPNRTRPKDEGKGLLPNLFIWTIPLGLLSYTKDRGVRFKSIFLTTLYDISVQWRL